MAAPTGDFVPFPPSPGNGAVRDLRETPTDHLWQWMRRLTATMMMSSSRQVRDTQTVVQRVEGGNANAAAMANTVADRAETMDNQLDLLDDILSELDRRFGHRTRRGGRRPGPY